MLMSLKRRAALRYKSYRHQLRIHRSHEVRGLFGAEGVSLTCSEAQNVGAQMRVSRMAGF